jgi:hypothetical protein
LLEQLFFDFEDLTLEKVIELVLDNLGARTLLCRSEAGSLMTDMPSSSSLPTMDQPCINSQFADQIFSENWIIGLYQSLVH